MCYFKECKGSIKINKELSGGTKATHWCKYFNEKKNYMNRKTVSFIRGIK